MRVLQVIPAFIPAFGFGGALNVCYTQSKSLIKLGHEVTVVTTDAFNKEKRLGILSETIDGIKIIRFKNISNRLAKLYGAYLPIGFKRWVKNNIRNYDVIYCHDTLTYQNYIISKYCRKFNIPYLIQTHGNFTTGSINSRFKVLKRLLIILFFNIFSKANYIVAVTRNEKDQIIKLNKNLNQKTIIIPNAIDTKNITIEEKLNLNEKYNIPYGTLIIGFIGRIHFIKGLDISLDILRLLKDKLKFVFLVIGPDDGEKKNLELKSTKLGLLDNIIFTDLLSGEQKYKTMKSCDLFLFTSRSEGLPISVIEVASLGIPQIISENCNVPEVSRYEAGIVCQLNNLEKIAMSILYLAENKDIRIKMGKKGIQMVEKCFDIQSVSNNLEKYLKKSLVIFK
jgi:glycosyltransferase involved in cell wall biosynthesis